MSEGDHDPPMTWGRDEMNLAEFPITSLAERIPPGCKTLIFEGTHGTLTVTGSDDHGLPTAPDSDVIVGLIQLTKVRNDFTAPTVEFTRYELLKLLGWPDQGQSYHRLKEALRRWVSVTLHYDGCWWDNQRRRRISASFHILDDVTLYNDDESRAPSSFTWGKRFFKSCRDGNLKRLDPVVYFGLRSAVSKRMYRFLDKRFHVRAEWIFDLKEFAFAHIGLSRSYAPWKVREKLKPALEELEAIDFLAPDTARYINTGRGKWMIRLARRRAPIDPPAMPPLALVPPAPAPDPEPSPLVAELIARGVTATTAAELVRDFPEARLRAHLAAFDWLVGKKDRGVAKNAPGYLVDSIRKDYAPPEGFVARTKRAARAEAEADQAIKVREKQARERAEQAQVESYWAGLSPEEQAALESEALEQADPETRAHCSSRTRSVRELSRRVLREAHIRRRLGLPSLDGPA